MRRHRSVSLALIAAVALVLGACGDDADEPDDDASPPVTEPSDEAPVEGTVEVAMVDAEGTDVGTVTLIPEGGATQVEADVDGLEPGFHGFHIHDVGICEPDAPDGPFTTATDLEIAAAAYERQVSEVVAEDEDMTDYVVRLAERFDNGEEEESEASLAEEVERYLRERPPG